MSRLLKSLVLAVFAAFGLTFFNSSVASAAPYDQVIVHAPHYIAADVQYRCDIGWAVVQQQWVSARGAPTSLSVTVPYGATSAPLQLNYLTYRCNNNSGIVLGSFQITATESFFSPNVPQLNGLIGDMPYGGLWEVRTGNMRNFDFPVGTATSSREIHIAFESRGTISWFLGPTNCAIWEDGDYSGAVGGPHDFGPCARGWSSFAVYMNVGPPPDDSPTPPIFSHCPTSGTPSVNVSWSGTPGNIPGQGRGFWLDVDNDNNWSNGYIAARFVTSSPVSLPPPALTAGNTYYVRIGNGSVHSATSSFTARTCAPPQNPTADLRVNGLDFPSSIESGEDITVSWTSQNATRCVRSGGEWGSSSSNIGLSGTINRSSDSSTPGTKTYRITCSSSSSSVSDEASIDVINKPYLRIYGGDVMAGASVPNASGSCSANSNAQIAAYNRGPSGSYSGAGVQFAAQSTGNILDFASAALVAPPKKYTFSNQAGNPTYGGRFGTANCAADYSTATATESRTGNYTLSPRTVTGHDVVKVTGGNVTVSGTGNSVVYGNDGSWSMNNIPSFYLIVVGGDIYINRNITRLDGVYVAQPDNSGNGGNIYTCTNGSSRYTGSSTAMAADCSNKLLVNGAFIAKKVYFHRTNGTLRQSAANRSADSSIAEQFNYGPELWLTKHGLFPMPRAKYDSILNLPPVL